MADLRLYLKFKHFQINCHKHYRIITLPRSIICLLLIGYTRRRWSVDPLSGPVRSAQMTEGRLLDRIRYCHHKVTMTVDTRGHPWHTSMPIWQRVSKKLCREPPCTPVRQCRRHITLWTVSVSTCTVCNNIVGIDTCQFHLTYQRCWC